MIVRFLNITPDESYLIGYKLKLSPAERAILLAIASTDGASADMLLSILPNGIARGNIAVHINSINKKATAVSARKLVLFENDRYILNPNM